jgi:penicillin amidase
LSRFAKLIIGLIFILVAILVGGALFLRHLVTKSFPVTSGTLIVPGLLESVEVWRDDYGVPHISASNDHDLMFAVGYVHAQDRLWQMDVRRRAGEGRLSEVFGEPTVKIDKLFRTLDFPGLARRIEEQLHEETRSMLEAYAAGINAFIDSHHGKFPIEFDMLDYEPEPWTVVHSIYLARLLAWELNLAWWTDIVNGEIAARVPLSKLSEIIPDFPDSLAIVTTVRRKAPMGLHEFKDSGRLYAELFGGGGLDAGSNGWVVNGEHSFSGKPILANDPHLALPAPSRWYQLHLHSPGWNVQGVSLPGAPIVVIGQNDFCAWGLTNAMIDDADFYIEQVDSTDPDSYIVQRSMHKFERREETIRIGKSDSVTINIRSTIHGPVVNDVHPVYNHDRQDSLRQAETGEQLPVAHEPISMRWTGFELSDEFYGFYLMNRAQSIVDFERGIRHITVPGQAIVYSDTLGNIACWTTGRIPVRGKQGAYLPLPGFTGDTEWRGFVPFDQLPRLLNPPDGIIVCANQKIADASFPFYVSTLWQHPARLQRIRQLLHSTEKFTVEDFRRFQHDVVSGFAEELTRAILNAYRSEPIEDPLLQSALNYLRNWNYQLAEGDVATTIVNSFFVEFLRETFQDEMGEPLFQDFVFYGATAYRITSRLLAQPTSSPWFDDVRTADVVESREMIVRSSFAKAVEHLRQTLGGETKNWQWGTVHSVTFNHPFGTRLPLDRVFNIGPFGVPGGGTTVNKLEYRISSPFTVAVGASMRQVVDMADPTSLHSVITTGQSGQALHEHYDDQAPLWLNRSYRRLSMNWNEIRTTSPDRLILQPSAR